MKLDELELEAERLAPGDRRKLMSFLVRLEIRTDEQYHGEITRRLDDRSPERWMRVHGAEEYSGFLTPISKSVYIEKDFDETPH